MTTDITRIDAAAPAPAVAANAGTANPDASRPLHFQQLLERLQKLAAEQQPADEVQDTAGLGEAMRTADAGFAAAMDLRRQLEEAWQRHMP